MDVKLDFDATKLFIALKYQILVAMECCHLLGDDESLWIEVFGDVTVSDKKQIEVKYYADNLTDSHHNFWKTLNNWLKPEFDCRKYTNLVLLTTQIFGENASLKSWDSLTAEERLKVLEDIYNAAEARLAESDKAIASKSLKLQREVLAYERRSDLMDVLEKMQIATDQPNLTERIARYQKQCLRAVWDHRCDEYMNDMFGFMTSPILMTSGWQITGQAFTSKTRELTSRYMAGTLKFPEVDHEMLECTANGMDVQPRRFAKKLSEIGADSSIRDATVDLLCAQHYISELIEDCTVSQSDIKDYTRNQYKSHISSRRSYLVDCPAGLSIADLHKKSQKFYFERCALQVDRLCGYDHTPSEFRNGIYQMLADEEPSTRSQELHWKMWE
ncbi:hypothetical protein SAMN05216315_11639 [Nitrosospira sp. Nsp18]|uniref:hypothetical protein n=1 Tax=Nitrosospira sp. Nsp18 TaxID=1855334 RepID=UPI0008811657|nr:hypothetical protein [Nitrosospira sp. Nsp18]SDA21424.1 hypothetical protein SAMN05216315_11639 [Nitrosospira sp. Nsp18]